MAKKRLNYFTGEFLKEDDFRTEQQYHVDMHRLHNKNLHEWGIADGLDVTFKPGEKKITISEGMAVDAEGKQIVLDIPKEIDLSTSAVTTVYISISYKETFGDSRTDTGITGFARIIEEPEIKYPGKPSDPSMALILAKVSLNPADKTIVAVDPGERKRAGVVAGDLEANSVAFSLPIAKNLLPRMKGVGTGGLSIDVPNGNIQVNSPGTNFSGNVGIGTASPESKLHVSGGDIRLDANRELLFKENGQIRSLDNNHRILFRRTENKLELREFGDLVFSPGATTGAETAKAVMLANGNVGIGTSSPLGRLNIVGSDGVGKGIQIDNREIKLRGEGDAHYSIFANRIPGTLTIEDTSSSGGMNTAGIVAMAIAKTSGNIGIGTTSPGEKLEIVGNLKIAANDTFLDFGADTRQMINLWGNGPNAGYGIGVQAATQYYRSAAHFAWYIGGTHSDVELNPGGGAVAMVIKRGSVGIGTPTPGATLDVEGSIKSSMWNVTQLFNSRIGALPLSGTFTSGGGVLIIFASGSGWADSATQIGMEIKVNDVAKGQVKSFTNEAGSHKTFSSNPRIVTGISAGTHTLSLVALPNTRTDANDFFNVTVLELPWQVGGLRVIGGFGVIEGVIR